jgi:hypothetical protein
MEFLTFIIVNINLKCKDLIRITMDKHRLK